MSLQLPKRRRIFLMRHGEVRYYENGQVVPPDGVRLTEEGRAQAAAAAQVLADVPFDVVISSGLPRTNETAQIVVGERATPIRVVPELQEIRGGDTSSLSPEEFQSVFLETFSNPLTPDDRFLLGETFGAFQARVIPAFQALLNEPSWQNALVVVHGAVNRILLAHVLGVGLDAIGHIEQDAACINLIDVDQHGYGIARLVNFTPYNPLKVGLSLTTMEHYFLIAQNDS